LLGNQKEMAELAHGGYNGISAEFSWLSKAFYKSRGMELALPYMKVGNKIPYSFSEEEASAIFNSTINLKHFAMLNLI
jgi:hypothetical protein